MIEISPCRATAWLNKSKSTVISERRRIKFVEYAKRINPTPADQLLLKGVQRFNCVSGLCTVTRQEPGYG